MLPQTCFFQVFSSFKTAFDPRRAGGQSFLKSNVLLGFERSRARLRSIFAEIIVLTRPNFGGPMGADGPEGSAQEDDQPGRPPDTPLRKLAGAGRYWTSAARGPNHF